MANTATVNERFEVLHSRDNGRGYHTGSYAITAETYDEAVALAKERWANCPPVEQWFVSKQQQTDGRWYCTWSYDSSD